MLSSNFYSKQQINVKNDDFRDFQWFSPQYTLKTWLPWQQGRAYTYHSDFKISPIHAGESPKVSEENLSPLVIHQFEKSTGAKCGFFYMEQFSVPWTSVHSVCLCKRTEVNTFLFPSLIHFSACQINFTY